MRSTTAAVVAAFATLFAAAIVSSCAGPSGQHSASAAQSSEQSDHNDKDVEFARQMVPLDEQAIRMAQLVPTNTKNPQLLDLALRIVDAEYGKIQAFRSFLVQWPDPEESASQQPPGMVEGATMDKLKSLSGPEFDQLWLRSMIHHHRGAIAMAQDEIAHGKNGDVIYLARSIVTTEQPQIDQMNQILGG